MELYVLLRPLATISYHIEVLPRLASTREKSSPLRMPDTLRSMKTVKPSFSQNDSQLEQVTVLPVHE